ncbi:MAG: hypothetical protein IPJ41_17045 [Phycisphaerales bacterium]|nr:hypothetical protein [Phycisphaerales bacterium]
MIVLKPSRTKPKSGDLFVCNMRGEKWVAGRVIHNQCRMMSGTGNEFLVYFYRMTVSDPTALRPPFTPDLLIPPVVTNALGWRVGLFHTLGNYPLQAGETLGRHYFKEGSGAWGDPEADYYDEFHEPSPSPGPHDQWTTIGLSGYAGVDIELSKALDIEPAWDPLAEVDNSQSDLFLEGASVIVYLAVPDVNDESGLAEIEASLGEALDRTGAGEVEGHGVDLATGRAEIRFVGRSPARIRDALLPTLHSLMLPPGCSMVVGGKRPKRIEL